MSVQKREFNNIARLVKSYRTPKGLSQTQLSKELGYQNGQFISNVERGLCSIPFEKIGKLSKVLEVPASEVKSAILNDYSTTIDKHIVTPIGQEESTQTTSVHTKVESNMTTTVAGDPANQQD